MPGLVAVHGATGLQGGSVVNSLLEAGWKVRALSRNVEGEKSQALAKSGADVQFADFDNEDSLKKAYEGVDAIFLVTNYWEHLFAEKSYIEAGDAEYKQALTVVKIADKLPQLKHFIWSTLPGNAEDSKPRTAVAHMDKKAQIDFEIKQNYPNLAAKTTYLYVGFYANNFINFPACKPIVSAGTFGIYTLYLPAKRTTVMPSAGDVTVNVGLFVRAALEQPEKTLGQYLGVVTDTETIQDLMKHWSTATGKPSAYIEINADDYNTAFGDFAIELGGNLKLFEENPEWAFDNTPLSGKDLGIESKLVGTKAFLESAKEQLL